MWTPEELAAITQGNWDELPRVALSGFVLDSRAIGAGEVFVALKSVRDGHAFVGNAFRSGAAAALVARTFRRGPDDGALLRVDDPLAALEAIGTAARARLQDDARVVAVTGSVGKTGTKEMLRLVFSAFGRTHAPEKSFNNQWGVPLTLARMPADTKFGVFEIGMNHPGEITPLTKMVRPHAAMVTTVAPVHLGQFDSVEQIAEAKAEIFFGLVSRGVAILNRDNPHYLLLAERAKAESARIMTFGRHRETDCRLLSVETTAEGSVAQVMMSSGWTGEVRLSVPGAHHVHNALAVLLAAEAAGLDVAKAARALAGFNVPEGRGVTETISVPGGSVLLIDESYNANPASMAAAISVLGLPREGVQRRVAVMGDMLELGETGEELHAGLTEPLERAGVDTVFACGPLMSALFDALPPQRRGTYADNAEALLPAVLADVRAGDAVMIKGSLGSRMGPLLAALKSHLMNNQT